MAVQIGGRPDDSDVSLLLEEFVIGQLASGDRCSDRRLRVIQIGSASLGQPSSRAAAGQESGDDNDGTRRLEFRNCHGRPPPGRLVPQVLFASSSLFEVESDVSVKRQSVPGQVQVGIKEGQQAHRSVRR